ncbi:hypothetical protein GV827_20285 [Sulfitobacter sp. JBTF-M27]|uniref:Putative Flp pilus-assembly TadG-like N-terminal domain-containing protein n=1 Tax=Sulfitobacter sediminilitoris TaxID=2698830 RepID=A0A6P0CFM8_9RHOB|nr:pilus assembly protein TadG-related protein [Sulfitobacter sediminilitoris]NEK24717.1 hypothetical protein [Sulfitobacter sediminilitoris]
MKQFFRSEDGYVLLFAILVLPVFIWFGLLIIDVSRGNNAHGDLQSAADALALAGARELDGRSDAIMRAKAAMSNLQNSVSMLGLEESEAQIPLNYDDADDRPFDVVFLRNIPDDDATPIDADWLADNETIDGTEAKFVYVRAQSQDLQTFFLDPRSFSRSSVPIAASAVATSAVPVACNVIPIYICNPFEATLNPNLNSRFAAGELYGRLIELHLDQSSSPGPGNFGFLRTAAGSGGDVLREALAIGDSGVCYSQSALDTEPGQNVGPIEQGINTHFGLYAGLFWQRRNDPNYRPALNVRMGQTQDAQYCSVYDEEPDNHDAMALPRGEAMLALPGGFISDSREWNIDLYWDISHGAPWDEPLPGEAGYVPPPAPTGDIWVKNTYPGPTGTAPATPSRYDTYMHEIYEERLGDEAPNGEVGVSQCTDLDLGDYTGPEYRDRRVIFSAVINCLEHNIQGAATDIPAETFVKMFLTKPAVVNGATKYLSMEIIDVTGSGGRGTMAELLREESFLVR